jgi:hypothetical protein
VSGRKFDDGDLVQPIGDRVITKSGVTTWRKWVENEGLRYTRAGIILDETPPGVFQNGDIQVEVFHTVKLLTEFGILEVYARNLTWVENSRG